MTIVMIIVSIIGSQHIQHPIVQIKKVRSQNVPELNNPIQYPQQQLLVNAS